MRASGWPVRALSQRRLGSGVAQEIRLSDGAVLTVRVDGVETYRTNLPNLDGGYQVNNEYNADIPANLPAGNPHRNPQRRQRLVLP